MSFNEPCFVRCFIRLRCQSQPSETANGLRCVKEGFYLSACSASSIFRVTNFNFKFASFCSLRISSIAERIRAKSLIAAMAFTSSLRIVVR